MDACDPEIGILAVRDSSNRRLAALATIYSMHPTILHEDSTLISADFPFYARETVCESLGRDVVVIYHNGPSGNQSPRHNVREQTFSEAERLESYAFKCTAKSSGNDQLPDLRASSRSHFIATTVDLLTTGVDVPCVKNIVFFKYLKSPISFHQMVGRGTRIDEVTGKLMFRVYDYTNATRLFGQPFITKPTSAYGARLSSCVVSGACCIPE